MFVQVQLQLGLGRYSSLGVGAIDLGSTDLTTTDINSEAAHSGSFHILSMGQHFYEYVVDPNLPSLRTDQALPMAHPYVHLAGKIRDSGVTGNIGEAVASVIACRFMGLGPTDIAHVKPNKPFKRRRSPDYLMRIGASPSWLTAHRAMPGCGPEWWPVESKARSTQQSQEGSLQDAYGQLVAYWHTVHQRCPNDVGYGVVVSLAYNVPRRILLAVFMPADQNGLLNVLKNTDYTLLMLDPVKTTRRYLHGC